ncbi:hypothetical protein J437_LFUL018297 [Ladona fulva]|uniref:CCHC-type domain-containing protein n=1 Tax=Ladona fulva TaxID=123851 RepID=A0A8K0PBH7_LADFU|nr:hypothetical protein J437_LFUL018297 [Ladona fulva]
MSRPWLTRLREIEEKVRNCKVTATTMTYIYERVEELRSIFVDMEIGTALKEMKENLKTELVCGIKGELSCIATDMHNGIKQELSTLERPSYAKIVQNLQEESKEKKELIIMTTDKSKPEEPQKIKEILRQTIKPGQDKIKINGIRNAGRKGVIIEMETEEDKNKIYKVALKTKLAEKGLKVEHVRKREPKIIIFSVDRSLEVEDLKTNVFNQNMRDDDITEEDFKNGFKLAFTTGRRDSRYCNYVFQVTPLIRDLLLQKQKIYSDWTSHYVKDYIGVTRCYKCQGYGHTAQGCREKDSICSYCARSGHTFETCPRKDKKSKERCANCHRFGRDAHHSTLDRECPAYKHALEQEILRTNYSKN